MPNLLVVLTSRAAALVVVALLLAGCTSSGGESSDAGPQDELATAPQPYVGQPNALPQEPETETETEPPVVVVRPSGPTCDPSGRQVPPDEELDWSDFLRFDGRLYLLADDAGPVQLAEQVGRVSCRLVGSGTPRDYAGRDGDAAYLEVGTAIHRVLDSPLDHAVGVRVGDEVELYRAV